MERPCRMATVKMPLRKLFCFFHGQSKLWTWVVLAHHIFHSLNRRNTSMNRKNDSVSSFFCPHPLFFWQEFTQSCVRFEASERPTAHDLLFHRVLFEVHSLKLLAAHCFINHQCKREALNQEANLAQARGQNETYTPSENLLTYEKAHS